MSDSEGDVDGVNVCAELREGDCDEASEEEAVIERETFPDSDTVAEIVAERTDDIDAEFVVEDDSDITPVLECVCVNDMSADPLTATDNVGEGEDVSVFTTVRDWV